MRATRPLPSVRAAVGALAAAFALGLSACGGGGGSGGGDGTPAGSGVGPGAPADAGGARWTVDRFAYVGGGGGSTSTRDAATGIGIVFVTTTGFDRANGPWSGSGVGIGHTLDGPGTYAIVPANEPLTPGSRAAQVNVTVGTLNVAPLAGVRYDAESGQVLATVDEDGRYTFSTGAPLTATQTVVLGEGIDGAPATVDVTLAGVRGVER